MDLKLKGKVAIVTGASRGIGRAIANELADEGMKLVLVARSNEQLNEVANGIETECLVQPVDLRELNAAEGVVNSTFERFGRIDLVVNNAGATKRGDFLDLSNDDWQDGFALKFFGAMRMSRAAWPHLVARHGSIVFVSGIGGRTGSAEFAIGGSVNAALLNLTKSLSDRGTKDGVRVNAVNPSSIMTDRLKIRISNFASENETGEDEAAELMSRKLGIERFGEPIEIAAVVAFLASSRADYCRGCIVDVDGGKTLTL